MIIFWLLLALLPQSSLASPAVTPYTDSTQSVIVDYQEKGYLLALMPFTFDVQATAYADGTVELNYPWYSFLTLDNEDQVRTELEIAVATAILEGGRSLVKAEGLADHPEFSGVQADLVSRAIRRVLEKNSLSLKESSV